MTVLNRRLFNIGLAGAIGGVALGSSTLLATAQASASGGTLTVGTSNEPGIITGVLVSQGSAGTEARILEGLLNFDFDFNPQPYLATEWETSADGLEYTFKLRDGVKWHDGQPFTSADVAFTILALKEVNPRRRITFANVVEVRTPDELTAVIVLSKPAPYLLGSLSSFGTPILPRHIYEGTDVAANPANSAPIGTGPFIFKEWVRGSHYILERNPNYWDEGKPLIDRIITRFIPDAGARVTALETGEVDLIQTTGISYPEIDRLSALPFIQTEKRGFNYFTADSQVVFNLDTPELADVKVRKSIAHAVDYAALVDTVWYGHATAVASPIGPLLKAFHDDSLPIHSFDVALAETLLDEAGFPRKDGGIRFTLRARYNPLSNYVARAAEFFRSSLAAVGIDLRIETSDFPTYLINVYTNRDFDLDFTTLTNGYDPSDGVHRLFDSRNFRVGLPWSNGSHYANPAVDELLDLANAEIDPAKRREIYLQFQRIAYDDLPVLPLVQQDGVLLANQRVKDFVLGADGYTNSWASLHLES